MNFISENLLADALAAGVGGGDGHGGISGSSGVVSLAQSQMSVTTTAPGSIAATLTFSTESGGAEPMDISTIRPKRPPLGRMLSRHP